MKKAKPESSANNDDHAADGNLLALANGHYEQERWVAAKVAYLELLAASPDDHWLQISISSCIFEERKYEEALSWATKAASYCPACPRVMWHHAGALAACGRYAEAERLYRLLIKRGWRRVAYGLCGEGESIARELLNDCRLALARTLARAGQHEEAVRWGRLHLRLRHQQELSSVYDREFAVSVVDREVEWVAAGRYFD